MINLSLGRIEVDWGKNNYFTHHGALFQPNDATSVPTYYAGDDWPRGDPHVEMKEGYSKCLREVRDRLELMGHTLKSAEAYYAHLHQLNELEEQPVPFADLCDALKKVDVSRFTGSYREDYQPGQFVRAEIIARLAEVSEAFHHRPGDLRPDHWEVDLLLENFGASNALRLLAQNDANLSQNVTWNYGALIESGWANLNEFTAGAPLQHRFLVVTEGSSDSKILQKALELYRPHISDFFSFVDMQEGYPFTGTGNLFRFAQGLVSIGILNNTLVIYDNDAEGVSKAKQTSALSLPINMRVMTLPDVPEFEEFETVGPTGPAALDINGKAAAIECYLDLAYLTQSQPQVRWTSFNKDAKAYQGELIDKTEYMKKFLSLRGATEGYDSHKMALVLDNLISECVAIAEAKLIRSFGEPNAAWRNT